VVERDRMESSGIPPGGEKRQKSDEIDSHLVWVLDELLDDPEVVVTVACGKVGGDGITRHALVHSAGPIVTSHVRNARDNRAILASGRISVKRDATASTYRYG
jgi:hypothetical protein